MRKAFVLLIVLLSSFSVFAAERFYCLNATDNIGTGNSQYRFNYSTVFDLSDHFVGQSGIYPIYSDYASSSYPDRQLNEQRAIGTVGVADCSHRIKYTITATNSGRFVSQSDPSKYREYYVVAVPDQGSTTRRLFYYPNDDTANSLALNTRTGNSMTMTTIKTNSTVTAGSGTNRITVSSMGIDLFLCMEELTDEDRLHLAPSDDYYATIHVAWECAESTCNGSHFGSFDITVRGYFGSSYSSAHDEIFLLITPTAESNNMNIKELAREGNSQTISHFQINTTTVRKTSNNNNNHLWTKHIFAFLSACSDYSVSDANGFLLKKIGTQSVTIPYELTVYNTTGGARTTDYHVYDGTQNFATGTSAEQNMCLTMGNYSKTFVDTFNGSYNAINYEGEVVLSIKDFEIPGSGLSFFDVMQNPTVDQAHQNYYTSYIGRYESNIYYHIVYSDTPLN